MKRVLLVDDEEHVLTLFKDELNEQGYDVATAASGQAALAEFARQTPDLVVLDIRMPDMHGLEVLEKIREQNETVPVVMCTALRALKDDYTVWASKVAGYLTKPLDLDEFVAKVKEVIGEP